MNRPHFLGRAKRLLRFLVAGGLNTLVTYALYLGLLRVMPYQAAYSISFVAGVLLSYWLNLRFVFRTQGSWRKIAMYPLVYAVQYVVGIGLLTMLVQWLELRPEWAPLAVIVITIPVTYLLSSLLLRDRTST